MKTLKSSRSRIICLAITLSAAFATAQAAPVLTTGTFTDDTVLTLAGTSAQEVDGLALDADTSSVTTANGYTFDSAPSGISSSIFSPSYSGFLGGTTSGDTNFDQVLNNGDYPGAGVTFTLNDLTGGDTYSALVFTADDRGGGGYTSFELTDGSTTSAAQTFFYSGGSGNNQSEGGYLLDTFVEAGTGTGLSHSITVNGPTTNGVEVEGVLVTDVTPAATTPEPGTYALLGLGLAALVFVVRKRSSLN